MILPHLGGITGSGSGKSNRGTKGMHFDSEKYKMGVRLMRLKKQFLSVCPLRKFLIPIFCICFSLQTVQAAQMLIPSGRTVGVTMDTKGLLVLDTGTVDGENNQIYTPCKGILQAGDLLLKADGQPLENKEMFMEAIQFMLENDNMENPDIM